MAVPDLSWKVIRVATQPVTLMLTVYFFSQQAMWAQFGQYKFQ